MANSLIDTNILSQPLKPKPHEAAMRWLLSVPREETYLSVISIQEIRTGVELVKSAAKKQRLESWLGRTRRRFSGRILPVTEEVAEAAGRLVAGLRKGNDPVDPNDVLLAATAQVHGLEVVTLNRKHFKPLADLGVNLIMFD